MRLEKIGKYDVVRVLGKGSTGKVYKAFDPIIDRFVALKVIPGEIVSQPEHLQRFKKEVKAQGRVLHPNVATIFDVDFSDGNYVIVMEYVEGRSLRDLMQAEKDILVGLDFFIGEGKYTAEDRVTYLDDGVISNVVALNAKQMLDSLGLSY